MKKLILFLPPFSFANHGCISECIFREGFSHFNSRSWTQEFWGFHNFLFSFAVYVHLPLLYHKHADGIVYLKFRRYSVQTLDKDWLYLEECLQFSLLFQGSVVIVPRINHFLSSIIHMHPTISQFLLHNLNSWCRTVK
jgi:hypothetical protein